MAEKVNIGSVSKSLSELLEQAEAFNVKKSALFDNIQRLEKAIPLFEKITNLYQTLDPSSARAKNYFTLASGIASITDGGAYTTNMLLSRESSLADQAGAGKDDRLSHEELSELKHLLLSNKLKDFNQFFDIENLPAFENFKQIFEAIKDTGSEGFSASQSMSRHASGIAKSMSQVYTPDRPADANVSVSLGGDLVSAESMRQSRAADKQTRDAVLNTSKSIEASLNKKERHMPGKSVVKFASKVWKAPKGTWLGDLMQIVKWVGGAAATLGALTWAADRLNKWFDDARRGENNLLQAFNDRLDYLESQKDADLAKLSDPDKAAAYARGAGVLNKFTADDINLLNGYLSLPKGERGDVESWLLEHFVDKEKLTAARALIEGKSSYYYKNRVYGVDVGLLNGKGDSDAQMFIRGAESAPSLAAQAVGRRPDASQTEKLIYGGIAGAGAGLASGGNLMAIGAGAGAGYYYADAIKKWLGGEWRDGLTEDDFLYRNPREQWEFLVKDHPRLLLRQAEKYGWTDQIIPIGAADGKVPIYVFAELMKYKSRSVIGSYTPGSSKYYEAFEQGKKLLKYYYQNGTNRIPISEHVAMLRKEKGMGVITEEVDPDEYYRKVLGSRVDFPKYADIIRNSNDLSSDAAFESMMREGIERITGVKTNWTLPQAERKLEELVVTFENSLEKAARNEPTVVNQVTNVNTTVVDGSNKQTDPSGLS